MLFNSFSYPVFLACAVLLFWAAPPRLRPVFLIAAGLVYYASHDVGYLLLIGALAVFTWAAGALLLRRPDRRGLLPAAVAALVGVFIIFKYSGLLVRTAADATGLPLTAPDIVLPLGISFFTFEFVHYLTDIRRGTIGPHRSSDFFAFLFFFPTLISGPIKRFQAFRESLHAGRFDPALLWTGGLLLLLGYAQKYLLADPLIPMTQQLAHPEVLQSRLAAAGGLLAYSLRLYFDFAGLSNIAVGSSMLFGILVPVNFRAPYLSSDLQQFWRRWHMSLGSWVRDYIYITLGGSRRGPVMTSLNLLLAMAIVGIWHGAGWNFAVWGLYHGGGLIAHRLWQGTGIRLPRPLGVPLTFLFVTIGWAFFVTSSLADSAALLSKIFSPW